jgi:SHS2 domain-containing protein
MKYKNSTFNINEDHTSGDFLFEAYGDTLNELFAACAAACFYAMTDLEKIRPVKEYSLELKGESAEDLLYNFISELIYMKDVEKVFLSVFNIEIAPDCQFLNATVMGEPIDYKKHTIKTDVKAATYHDLTIQKLETGFQARMMLDL